MFPAPREFREGSGGGLQKKVRKIPWVADVGRKPRWSTHRRNVAHIALRQGDCGDTIMAGLLIILIALGLGFGAGYAVRAAISQRRRRAARGDAPKLGRQPGLPGVASAGRDDTINLEGLLVAANDDVSGRRQQSPPREQGFETIQPEQFDGAVRDLLGELNRRPSEPPSPAQRAGQ
jgi:hypothetical protein